MPAEDDDGMSEQPEIDSDIAGEPVKTRPVDTGPEGPGDECPPGYVLIGGECVETGGFRDHGR